MEFPSKKFIIVRDKAGAAVLTSPDVYNTIAEARSSLKSIVDEQFSDDSGWVATWCPGDRVEISREGLQEKFMYVIQELNMNDVYEVQVNIPMWTRVKALSLDDAQKKAVAKAESIIMSKKVKDELTNAGLVRSTWRSSSRPITVACENAEVKE